MHSAYPPCPCFHLPQVPSRAATLAEQEGTNKEIADLQQQSADLDALFEQRKQQFAGVSAGCSCCCLVLTCWSCSLGTC